MNRGFTFRFIIYGIVAAYVTLDVKVFHGPVHTWVAEKRGADIGDLRAAGVAAMVYGQPIVESQVRYRIEEHLYVRGRSMQDVSAEEETKLFEVCLEELILEHLLRVKVHHNERKLPKITPEHSQTLVQQDKAQFSDERELSDALSRQGYIKGEMASRAHAHAQQGSYLDRQITIKAPASLEGVIEVVPEIRRIRHVFLSTHGQDPALVEGELQHKLAPLRTGWMSFEELSSQVSQDSKAKKSNGELGWVSSTRLPSGLAKALFTMGVGESRVVQSGIGWHFIEVLEIRAARYEDRSLDLLKADIENYQRIEGLRVYLRHLRTREDKVVVMVWGEE